MTHITIVFEEPTVTTLLIYCWHQLSTHEYAMVFVGVVLFQVLEEVFAAARSFRLAALWHPYLPVNSVLVVVFCFSGCLTATISRRSLNSCS